MSAALTPDQVVLKSLFEDFCNTEYPGEGPDEVFELYGALQVLKPKELTGEELAAGVVDGEKDGGLDTFFVFLNGSLLSPDDPVLTPGDSALKQVGPHPHLEIFLIQSKNRAKWEESVWEHLLSSLPNLLDSTIEDAQLENLYRAEVVERTGIFRRAVKSLGPKFPKVTFRTVYVTRAPAANLTPTILARAKQVAALIRSRLTSGAQVSAEHVGAEGLYTLAGTQTSTPGVLRFRQLVRESDSFVGVVTLKDYLAFVRNDEGALRDDLFDFNVRDYEGDNIVNQAIGETLSTSDTTEFWWLNNGVTILGDHVDSPQQTLTISRPLIVNGLQTSHVLHKTEQDGLFAEERLENGVLVRVIVSDDEDVRDRIIAGTNRQTRVPAPALYATQELQRDIEKFLLVYEWYYERRKNRYRNQGKPAKRRITINLLAQAMISLSLGQPDVARARPSTLLGTKAGYDSVFPESLDRNAYLKAIEIVKSVDAFLSTSKAKAILDEYTNSRFYVAAGYLIRILKIKDHSNLRFDSNFKKVKLPLHEKELTGVLTELAAAAGKFQLEHEGMSRDSVFKSSEFRSEYFKRISS